MCPDDIILWENIKNVFECIGGASSSRRRGIILILEWYVDGQWAQFSHKNH